MSIFNKKNEADSQGKTKAKEVKEKKPELKKERSEKSMKELYDESAAPTTATVVSEKGKDEKVEKQIRKFGNAYKVLLKPLITEKAAHLGTENKYVFYVATDANKIEISKAINEVYGVKPVSINIVRMQGKNVTYARIKGKRKDWKKAIVMLPKGKTINIYEGV
jgi:large subunit ribosomal protein L23